MKRAILRFLAEWRQAADQPLPGWLERACRRDPQLSQELQAGIRLTAELRRDPRERRLDRPSGLAGRVFGELAAESAAASKTRRPQAFAWVGVAACAALLAAVALRFESEEPRAPGGEPLAAVEIPTTLELAASQEHLAAFEALGREWVNPLDQEIGYVIADARNALDFLKSSFVPSGYLERRNEDARAAERG